MIHKPPPLSKPNPPAVSSLLAAKLNDRRTRGVNLGMTRILTTIVLCFVVIVAGLLLSAVRHGYDSEDTIACLVTTGQHSTRYSTGYTAKAFSRVRPGMTPEEVRSVLGEPLRRTTWSSWPEGDWDYSLPASPSGHYHDRRVRFGPDGRVSAVFKMFYFD